MEAGSASFVPFCVCVATASGYVPTWQIGIWSWSAALSVLLQIGIIFYALYEIDTGSSLWYLVINSTVWALAFALQPVFFWIRPNAANWFDSCDLGCAASTSYLYRSVNYYAFPDLVFVSVFVYLPLLVKWRYSSNVYIDTAAQTLHSQRRRQKQKEHGRLPIATTLVSFGFLAFYVSAEYILGRQTGAQLLANAAVCLVTLAAVSLADSTVRNAVYVYMSERRYIFQRIDIRPRDEW